jgi:outer membrane autotransporter protein
MTPGVRRSTIACCFAAALLATTSLTTLLTVGASPALADGGGGGGGPIGGVDSIGGAGGAGQSFGANTGGGGGGAGTSGGAGGQGNGGFGGAGGAGAPDANSNGQPGASDPNGGGGGGGGAHGLLVSTAGAIGTAQGSSGGRGGAGSATSGGGGGGAGGYGAVVTVPGVFTVAGVPTAIAAGSGGSGGSGGAGNGRGGTGGIGIFFAVSGATLTNAGGILGGGTSGPNAGVAGAGIVGSGLTVINSGSILGGYVGFFGPRANAITFTGGANTLTLQAGSNLFGNIAIQAGSLTFNQSTSQTLDNVITGAGSIIQNGTGTLTLTGANTYSGGISINAGTLAIGNSGLGTGTVTLNGGKLAGASPIISNDIFVTAAGGVVAAAAGGTLTLVPNSLSFSLFGNPAITFGSATDTGTVVYSAATSFVTNVAFSTVVGGGTLQAGSATFGSLTGNQLSTTIVNSGATLDFNDFSSTITNLQGAGAVVTGTGGNTVLSIAGGSFAGAISGAGQLAKIGTGTLVLTGANSYSGGTMVSGGILQGNSASLQGNIVNNAAVVFDQATTGTYAGSMSGSGNLTKANAGILILTGNNSYTGGTRVSGGILQLGVSGGPAGSIAGTVTVDLGSNFELVNGVTSGLTAISNSGDTHFRNGTTSAAARIDNAAGANVHFDNASSAGTSVVMSDGDVHFNNTATAAGSTITNGQLGVLHFNDSSTAGNTVVLNAGAAIFNSSSTAGSATISGGGQVTFRNSSTAGNAVISLDSGGLVRFADTASGGAARFVVSAGGTFDLSGLASPGTTAGSIEGAGSYNLGSKQLTVGANNLSTTVSGVVADGGTGGGTGASLVKLGSGTLTLSGNNTYTGGTTVAGGLIKFSAANNFGSGTVILNGGGLQWATGTTTDISSKLAPLGAGGGIFDTNGSNVTLGSVLSGAGALTKAGNGILTLGAANTYSGGTTVSGGLIAFSSANNFGSGAITLAGGGLQWAAGSTADISSRLSLGPAGGIFDTNGNNVSLATAITGTGGFTKQGQGLLNLTANNTYTGPTAVTAGTLAVNGSITSNVSVASAATLGGSGIITGSVTNNGIIAPGNSIGTLTINGSYTQAAGSTYQVELNAAGQSDRINVAGAPGTATIQGGTVQVLAQPGSYANSTTYTILNATGGVAGTYAGVTSNFAFLMSSLSYNANNVFLTLALQQNAFSIGGNTPNQKAVGAALDQSFANASGDFATVIGALAGLTTAQGPAALDAISGQPYADFGTMNINNSAMFMNALGQQMAGARGASSTAQRQALAQACDIAACDGMSPWGTWASALGGLGNVAGDGNSSTLSYNFGGGAAGIDYRFGPHFLVGIGAGYTAGTQWVNGFMGRGTSDSVAVAAYGSFTQDGFYADALAGYAYFYNQLQRQILIPGLQPRTANGAAGANQALGQLETGYTLGVFVPAAATVTPFARLQGSSVTQNAFSEWGAQSLSLNVAQQTTNSLRSTFGVNLGGAVPIGDTRTIDLGLRLGWQHEFASTTRPITAALSGAPFNAFTVYGATPRPDSAVVSFSARTNIAAATQLYLRYDGDIGSGTDNHTLNVGVRLSW